MKKSFSDYGKEWLDTLVVAISVAMCFRAYFYEPFNIPTGSMQPTLWGYHTTQEAEKTTWDNFPLSTLKWLWTGSRYVECRAPSAGIARIEPRNDGFANVRVGLSMESFKLPTDACAAIEGRSFRKGDLVWKGYVTTGDFIFVNRWRWNFVRPRTGEVMIFSTTGINGLAQGIHYIKRMKASPGQTYELEHPVPGSPLKVTMGEGEYYACGDNFNNSFDSRYWGVVPERNLCGVASVVFWPFSGWRIIR